MAARTAKTASMAKAAAKATKTAKTGAKMVEVEAHPAIKEERPARRPLEPLKVNTSRITCKKLYDSKSYRATL